MAHFNFAAVLCTAAIVLGENSRELDGAWKVSAVQEAKEWLQNYQDPAAAAGDEAGLEELKTTNPDAYAVVNALLTKRSLGLLNSRHPTAAMTDATAASMNSSPAEPQAEPKAAEPPSDVDVPPAPKHRDFLNWKPSNDDQMVSNVLGMVAGLKGGSAAVSQTVASSEEAHPQAKVLPQAQLPTQQLTQRQPQPQSVQSLDWGNTYAGFETKHDAAETVSPLPEMKMPTQQTEVAATDIDVHVPAAPRQHDFLNWKPANDDDQMVSNVLGMVAGLKKGGSASQGSDAASAPQVSDAASPVENVQPPVIEEVAPQEQSRTQPEIQVQPQAPHQQPPPHHASVLSFDWGNTYAGFQDTRSDAQTASSSPATEAPAQRDLSNNPYLKGIDFSSEIPQSTMSQMAENSYLKSVNNFKTAEAPKPKAEITVKDIGGPNKLTSFNWYTN